MAHRTTAYMASTGRLFMSCAEAEKDEIREAADILAGVEKSHLINLATGASGNQSTRAAILRLAEAIKCYPDKASAVSDHQS